MGLAIFGTRLMQRLLYDVTPGDPISPATAAAILLLVGLAANWFTYHLSPIT